MSDLMPSSLKSASMTPDAQSTTASLDSDSFADSQTTSSLANQDNAGLSYDETPIGRLDKTMLRVVFRIIADSFRPSPRRDVLTSWIKLGHVCAFWRAILMDMPELWGRDLLGFGVQQAFDDILVRTQDAPLELPCAFITMPPGTLARISPLISRASLLTCDLHTPEDQNMVLHSLTSRPLPLLQTLRLYDYCPSPGIQEGDYSLSISGLNNLCDLTLHGIFLRPPLSGHLASLDITPTKISSKLTLNDIFHALSHNTALKSLQIESMFFQQKTSFTEPQIFLPMLISLILSFDAIMTAPNFLDALHMPALETLQISKRYSERRPAEVIARLADSLSVCCAIFLTPSSPKAKLHIIQHSMTFTFRFIFCHEKPRKQQVFDICVPLQFPRVIPGLELLATTVKCFSDTQMFSCVRELSCVSRADAHQTAEGWGIVFPFLTNLERLVWVVAFDANAAGLASIGNTNSVGQPYFPNLRHVMVKCPAVSSTVIRAHQELKAALLMRAQSGVPVAEALFSVDIEHKGAIIVHEMEHCARELGIKLIDMHRSPNQLEWTVHADA